MIDETQQMPPPLERATESVARMNRALEGLGEALATMSAPQSRASEIEEAIKLAEMYRDMVNTYASAARAEVALFATISANSERELYIEELEGANELAWGTLGKLAFILGVDLPRDPQANPREQCDEIVRVAREVMVEANGRSEDE